MEKKQRLQLLKEKMLKDKSLPLRSDASNLVFGEGDPGAQVMFIGEGPGHWEDVKGRPFVGNAGALLNYLLQTIELPRDKVFITNVIHYRPPSNRDPLPEEIGAFRPYLDKVIEIVKPEIIVTLGRFSMAKFIPGVKISIVHGRARIVDWKGKNVIVIPMYHPAAALRNTEIKQKSIDDFKVVNKMLDNIRNRKQSRKHKQMKLV